VMRSRALIVVAIIVGAVLTVAAGPVLAVSVSAAELVADGESFSGLEVTVIGELVGDYGFRNDGSMWTQLNGDSYAIRPIVEEGPLRGSNVGIGIRMPADLAVGLDPPGRYRRVGPVVSVTGIWRYHDPDRQGESFLDVSALVVDTPGRDLSEHPNWMLYGTALALVATSAVMGIVYIRERDSVD